MYMETDEILQQQAIEIMQLIEDAVEYHCQENMISGEKAWVMIYALAEAKIKQFPDTEF